MNRILVPAIVLVFASPVRADDWTGKDIVPKKHTKEIKFSIIVDDKEVYVEPFSLQHCTALEDKAGFLRVFDEQREGWVDKNDFILESEATEYWNERIKADETDLYAIGMRGVGYNRKGDYDNAIKDFTSYLEIAPETAELLVWRGIAHCGKKDFAKGIADYDEALRINPQYLLAYCNRGSAWSDQGKYDKAIEDYSEAIKMDPKLASAYGLRGVAWSEKKDYDKAIADYTEALKITPRDIWTLTNRGEAWRNKREYDKAIADFSEVLKIDAKAVLGYSNRGYVRQIKGEYDQAIADYTQAIKIDPKYAWAYAGRGEVQTCKREYEKAIADYQAAIKLDPKDSLPLSALAWLHAACPVEKHRDGKKALEYANKATAMSDSWFSRGALAAAYAETGDFDNAAKSQVKAIEMLKADRDAHKSELAASEKRLDLYKSKKPYRGE